MSQRTGLTASDRVKNKENPTSRLAASVWNKSNYWGICHLTIETQWLVRRNLSIRTVISPEA